MTELTSVTSSWKLLYQKSSKANLVKVLTRMAKIGGVISGDGDAASTVQSEDSAEKCYDQYAILRGFPSLKDTTVESFCTEKFHWSFAWYLVLEYKSTRSEAYLMRGTVLLYMGCIMTIGQNKLFRGNPFFKDLESPGSWYTKMRCGIERKIISRSVNHHMTTLNSIK